MEPPDGRLGEASLPTTPLPEVSLPKRKWLEHAVPPWVDQGIFFVTINCRRRGANQLCAEDLHQVIIDSAIFHHDQRWWIHLWLLMPDHIHALLSFSPDESMVRVVRDWKRFVAGKTGIEWQKGFFDHRLRRDESLQEKAHYIRTNPVRAGLVGRVEDWPYVLEPGRDGSPSRPINPADGRLGEPSLAKALLPAPTV